MAYSAKNVGLYDAVANRWYARFAGWLNPALLTFVLAGLISVTTDNDDVILTLVPVLLALPLIDKNRHLLVAAFVAANSFSLFSLISNPTNIIVGTTFDVSFLEFFVRLWLPALLVVVAAGLVLRLTSPATRLVQPGRHRPLSPHQRFSLGLLVVTIGLLAGQSGLGLEAWAAVGLAGLVAFVRDSLTGDSFGVLASLPKAPGAIISAGFICLGLISGLGWDAAVGGWLSGLNPDLLPLVFFAGTLVLSVLIVNIPATLLASSVALSLAGPSGPSAGIFVAIVLGANLSALLHPRATLAGQLFVELAADKWPELKPQFWRRMRAPALVSIAVAGIVLIGI